MTTTTYAANKSPNTSNKCAKAGTCGRENPFVNYCGCDPQNLPTTTLISFPARPVNGGPLEKVASKVGDDWSCEPKPNGWRGILHRRTRQLWNRHGTPLSIADTFTEAIDSIDRLCAEYEQRYYGTAPLWLDLELLDRRHSHLRGCIIVLDTVLPIRRSLRRDLLAGIFPAFDYLDPGCGATASAASHRVRLIPSHPWSGAQSLYHDLQRINTQFDPHWRTRPLNAVFEGIVAKRQDAGYPIQLRSPDEKFPRWVKHRFA